MKFIQNEKSRKSFYELLRSNIDYEQLNLKDISKKKAVWAPIVSYSDERNKSFEEFRYLKSFQLMKSTHMAVIVPRYMISLPNIILRGILSCQQIIVLTLLLSILFGILIWMIERFNNEEFPKTFFKGTGTGIWWSLVSMTTVGYGDVVPRSLLGRMVAMIWVFIGVMIACVMTATTTEIVTGVDDLSVYGKKVSVLENSLEAKVASEDYRAIVVPVASYDEVLELVRHGRVFAAMMNADVAAWYQDEIRSDEFHTPLRIVQKLPANLYVNAMISANISDKAKKAFNCMYLQKDEVYSRSIERFRRYCHTETLYLDSFGDLFKQNVVIQILLGAIFFLMVLGLMFEFYTKRFQNKNNVQANEKLTMELLDYKGFSKKNIIKECHCIRNSANNHN